MELHGSTLVVVADGARARLFEERVRGGPLTEISDRLGDLSASGPRGSGHSGRVFDRFGSGSHTTGGDSPKVRDEAAFVSRLAGRLDAVVAHGRFEEAVLIAAPRALGGLRAALSGALAKRVQGSEAADRCSETADEIRAALRHIRLGRAERA
ncbi:host attachment protein [Brevundimonas sp.]|uniref:host attachment protein n=1 Tax=Brevundimonas sp. TaxID=1871086 RepID=UPI0025E86FF2|nr:host attachment protein [Brevundimonas sp.]